MDQEGDFIASIYYGPISSRDTEFLLERFGQDGSFMLRDSETYPGAYCLCVRKAPFVHTFRLVHSTDGWSLLNNPEGFRETFHKLEALIAVYRGPCKPDSSTVTLTYPLEKTQLPDSPFQPEYLEMST